ncbi:MAG: methyl-accepting chemotaxis protein [Lachnospiraceae bacterium]|nr:methyl-accepting chemotaxis protein [Lachnospiraceae bacterium]
MAEEKKVKMNQKLLNAKMEKKFSIAFASVTIGSIVIAAVAFLNMAMLAKSGGFNLFWPFYRLFGVLLLILLVIVNLIMIRVISKSLSQVLVTPIEEVQAAIGRLKKGDFNVKITYEGKDELGELAKDFNDTCVQMRRILSDAGYVLGEMAEGNFSLSTDMRSDYMGDFKVLLDAMDKLKDAMNGTMTEIRNSSEQVMVGAEQLAGSAQELAEGATNQAGAVEELSATIESVTGISEESAENAVKAATNAKGAAKDAGKSREEMNQLTAAMERITATSKEIGNIIAAIEDIASQTNLLALNASIEAARAGESGRGFAVVADQIGKLAADSSQSAISTKELINKCLEEVENGNHIVENTIDSIGTVLTNMEALAEMASGAAEASKSQADMLKQIEVGIEQITSVVQNNSATAEETSAVSEELSAQATNLESLVARFKLEYR